MNYRHIYHAGNFADVFKHVVLMACMEYLRQKEKPFYVLDTHAGIGSYDLQSVEAGKTKEAEAGIGRVWNATDLPKLVADYRQTVRTFNKGKSLRVYPGSPLIARSMLRPQDRLVVNELHPQDVGTLRAAMGKDARVKVEHDDGYIVLKAQLPPHERRGLVLIDPPFEERDEFTQLIKGLKEAHKRWATGTYIVWYPIKDRMILNAFHDELARAGIPDILAFDFYKRSPVDTALFNGTGLAIINPPWTLRAQIEEIAPWLVKNLAEESGSFAVRVIAAEA